MKKFIFRLFLAGIIGFFIYFFISGNSISDFTKDEGLISESNLTELREQVLGSFSGEDKSFSFEDVLGSNDTSTESMSEDKDPLSGLLSQFSSKDSDDSDSLDDEDQSSDIQESIDEIERDTTLPDFDFVCFPEIKRECNFDGCENSNPGIAFLLINSSDNLIHQCGVDECVSHDFKGREYSDSYNYQIQSDDDVFMLSREIEPNNAGRTSYSVIRTRGITTEIILGRCLSK